MKLSAEDALDLLDWTGRSPKAGNPELASYCDCLPLRARSLEWDRSHAPGRRRCARVLGHRQPVDTECTVPIYRLHDTTGDDLGLLEHPAPNVEPGDLHCRNAGGRGETKITGC